MYQALIKNPILRGFNPDPSIVKAEDTYFIAVSSFEWLPGVRVYESKDLVNWQFTTDLLTHQVCLKGNPQQCSIWAPHLSYSDGLFYLIYTEVKSTRRPFKDCHNYLMTAESIHGPWSTPVYLNSSGFDPALFHDENGQKWLVNEQWDYRLSTPNKSAGIVLQEFDTTSQRLKGAVYKIFNGTELAKTEAPQLYKHNGYYYLLTAEGGTGSGHGVTVCRAKKVTGPYELDPEYPMLTASDKPDSPLQCTGHGSLIQTAFGQWFMAYLCTRPMCGQAAVLGRETALQEVCWSAGGWLRLTNGGNGPARTAVVRTAEPVQQRQFRQFHDDFSKQLDPEWNAWRMLPGAGWCDTSSRPGYLRLVAGESLQSLFDNHLLAIRQQDLCFSAQTAMDYEPTSYTQLAGLTLFVDDSNYMYVYVTWDEECGKVLRFMTSAAGTVKLSPRKQELAAGTVYLKVVGVGPTVKFYFRQDQRHGWQELVGPQAVHELAGGYTGNFIGLAAQDMAKKAGSYADFDFFYYQGLDQ